MARSIHLAPDGEIETEADSLAQTVAKIDGNRLLKVTEGDSTGEWIVYPDEDRFGWAFEFKHEKDARLLFGLWARTGGFNAPESPSQNVPIEVVRQGRDAVAAYLLVGTGVKNSRAFVAKKLDVSEQTVSNYANRVRWTDENSS